MTRKIGMKVHNLYVYIIYLPYAGLTRRYNRALLSQAQRMYLNIHERYILQIYPTISVCAERHVGW